MRPEFSVDPVPKGIEQFYFAVVNYFGLGTVEPEPSEAVDKRVTSLLRVFDDATEEEASSIINGTLRDFAKRLGKRDFAPFDVIALEETILVHLWSLKKGEDLLAGISPEYRIHVLQLREEMT